MPPDLYSAAQVIDKTLMAKVRVPIFNRVPDNTHTQVPQEIGFASPGSPVGRVFSYIEADPTRGRQNLWWVFWPVSNFEGYYYAEHKPGNYDVSALRQQGAISVKEEFEKKDDADKPWYEKFIKQYGPWVVGLAVGTAVIRGLLSRRS